MLAMTYPVACCEFEIQGSVQAARRAKIGIFDYGILAQSSLSQPSAQTLAVPCGHFTVEQQAEPLFSGEFGGGRTALHLKERVGHGSHANATQSLSERMDQHLSFPFNDSSRDHECS